MPKTWRLDAFQLKILALIIMTLDHIHYFFGLFAPIPLVFTLIGRIAAPVFVFMVANGFAHTHNRSRYLLRLYIASVLMKIGNQLMNILFPLPNNAIIMNDIFSTMTMIVFLLFFLETVRTGFQQRRAKNVILGILGVILPFAVGIVQLAIMGTETPLWVIRLSMIFLPTPFLVEGGIIFVLLGIGFYYTQKSKKATAIFYTIFLLILLALSGISPMNLKVTIFMWLALPFILLYSGEKGRGMKYLFYIYYPAHVYLFAAIVSRLALT